MTTETIDRLYLELSHFTSAKTGRELELENAAKASQAFQAQAVKERDEARERLEWLHGHTIGGLALLGVSTPEEGFIAARHCLPDCFERAKRERDRFARLAARVKEIIAPDGSTNHTGYGSPIFAEIRKLADEATGEA